MISLSPELIQLGGFRVKIRYIQIEWSCRRDW